MYKQRYYNYRRQLRSQRLAKRREEERTKVYMQNSLEMAINLLEKCQLCGHQYDKLEHLNVKYCYVFIFDAFRYINDLVLDLTVGNCRDIVIKHKLQYTIANIKNNLPYVSLIVGQSNQTYPLSHFNQLKKIYNSMLSIVSALTVDTETIAAIIDDFLPLIADKITYMNSEDDIDSSVSDCLIGLSNLFQYSEYNRRVHDQLIYINFYDLVCKHLIHTMSRLEGLSEYMQVNLIYLMNSYMESKYSDEILFPFFSRTVYQFFIHKLEAYWSTKYFFQYKGKYYIDLFPNFNSKYVLDLLFEASTMIDLRSYEAIYVLHKGSCQLNKHYLRLLNHLTCEHKISIDQFDNYLLLKIFELRHEVICHKEIDQLLITSFCNMLINSDRIHDDLARILKVIYESHSEDIFEYDNEPWMIQFLHIKTELEINY